MRRSDREIREADRIDAIISSCHCCRLGFCDGKDVYIVPLNFGCTEEDGQPVLYFHSAREGHKLTLLRKNPVVGFEMDTGHGLLPGDRAEDYSFAYRSVLGRGTVDFLQEPAAKRAGLNCIMAHYTGRSDWTVSDAMLGATAVFRLRVTAWTAKEHKAP